MPLELEYDDNGDLLCPSCVTPNIIRKSDRKGQLNYFCSNCGWARLGGQDFFPPGKEDAQGYIRS